MGYDKFGLDWSVYGSQTPQRENAGNPMQGSIGRGWSQNSSNATPTEECDSQETAAAQPAANNVRITSAKFIPDEETDFLKECKIQIEAQGDPATADVALWGAFNGTDYDLRLSKKVDFTGGTAESTLKLEYVDEFYNEYHANGNRDAVIDYFFNVLCKGAEKKKSELLRMPVKQLLTCDFVEMPDVLFHHNSAVPCLDKDGILVGALVAAFVFAKNNPDREVVLFGHTDTSGEPDYNYDLSCWRADAIKALCDNDSAVFLSSVKKASKVEDYQTILKSLAESYGWSTDPGTVDNIAGEKTRSAVTAFQERYNNQFNGTLKVDGTIGPKTWEALFTVMRSLIEEIVKTECGEIPALTYGYNGKGVYPCGESFPVDAAEKDNYKSQTNRRVEIAFFEKGKSSELKPVEKNVKSNGTKTEKKSDKIVKKPITTQNVKKDQPPAGDTNDKMIFYAPGRDEYLVIEPAAIDAVMTEVKDLDAFSDEILAFRESVRGKKIDEDMTKKAQELQKKATEKFEGLTKEPSKAIQELLLIKSNPRWGKMKSRIYVRPAKLKDSIKPGNWKSHADKDVQKDLQDWLKKSNEKPEEKSKIESKLKATLFQSEKIDEQWPWKWKFKNEGSKDTAVGCFSGSYDVQFFRFVAGAKAEAEFDLNEKKLNLGADAGISYGIVDGSIKGEWGLPDQDGFNLYEFLILSKKAREAIKPNYECRFRFSVKAEGKLFAGASLAAVVALPCIEFGDQKSATVGGSVGGFAGASADGKLATNIEWCKNKTSKFDVLAEFGGNASGNAGIGAEGKFEFTYKDGKVKFVSGVMLTFGIGAKAGLAFEIGVDKAIELFSHMFRSVDWHRVDSVTLLAFEFYVNVTFAHFVSATRMTEYAYEKARGFWDWFNENKSKPKDLKQSKENIRKNVANTEQLKNAPPETMGHLIQTLMATVEEEDFDAIIKVLEAAESTHELKWVLRNAQEKIKLSQTSTKEMEGKALDEGIRKVLEFGGYFEENRMNRKNPYLKRIFTLLKEKGVEHTYEQVF